MEHVPSPELVNLPEDNYETWLVKLTEHTWCRQEKLLVLKAKEEAEKKKAKVGCQEEKEREWAEARAVKVAMQQVTAQLVPLVGLSRPSVSLSFSQRYSDY